MSTNETLLQALFQELSSAATKLNQTTDQLTASVRELDAAIGRLNLGIEHWMPIGSAIADDKKEIYKYSLGYAKVGKWGIAVRIVTSAASIEVLFNDAPRDVRVKAIAHLPFLLAELVRAVNSMCADIESQLPQAEGFVAAIKALPEGGIKPQVKR